MKLYSLNAVALALVALSVLGVVVPTAAVHGGGHDQAFAGPPDVSLQPADGPNGEYARFNGDGELVVEVPNVNPDADTRIDDVFVLSNGENTSVEIWITHDATDAVDVYVGDGRSIQGRADNLTLAPGERLTAGLAIDSTGREAGERLLSSIRLHARYNESEVRTDDGTRVDIEFDDDTGLTQNVSELDPSYLDDVPGERNDRNLTAPPRAVINRTTGDGPDFANEMNERDPRARGADGFTVVGETISLSGSRSLVNTSYAVDSERRLVKLADVPVPEEREEAPATIRFRVAEDRLGDSNVSKARVGRRTDGGWQLLPTTVVGREDGEVILRARTPGFSVFGVFADNEMTYTWETGNRTVVGPTADFNFSRPGYHRVNLTVTDSFGLSDTTTYRVLANDRPTVEIERPEDIQPNETIQLRANVTDEVGNTTITWEFADGSTATGRTVERAFERGEHVVSVTVEDEFNATGSEEATLAVGVDPGGSEPSLDVVRWTLGFEGRIVVVAVLAVLLLAGLRRLLVRRYGREERSRSRTRA